MKITISDDGADYIIDRLIESGYEAYYVGGCVRNAILQKPITDYDITTSALPDDVCNLFSHLKTFVVGIKHGTVSICFNDKVYEVTTFRKDSDYEFNRWPRKVEFCANIHDDLSRRDFTINAMAYNKNLGLIDDFGGIYDCHKGILRTVNNPNVRFEEDALRILRAMRFASTYSLKVDNLTAISMIEKASLLTNISSERILTEFSKCLLGENAEGVLSEFVGVVYTIFPELKKVPDINKLFCAVTHVNDLTEKYIILFSQIADEVKTISKRLKFSNYLYTMITTILSAIEFSSFNDPIAIKFLMKDLGDSVFTLINVKYALASSLNNEVEQLHLMQMREICQVIIKNNECYNLSQLAINGRYLLRRGIRGEEIKKKLNFALDAVICERIENKVVDILNYLGLNDYE